MEDVLWLGIADGDHVGYNEDVDVVLDALQEAFVEDKKLSPEQRTRMGRDMKLGDHFVTYDLVRQRAYIAMRIERLVPPDQTA